MIWILLRTSRAGVARIEQERWHQKLFTLNIDRWELLSQDDTVLKLGKALPKDFVIGMGGVLGIRAIITRAYRAAVCSTESFDHSAFRGDKLHRNAINLLGQIYQEIPELPFEPISLKRSAKAEYADSELPPSSERSRETSELDSRIKSKERGEVWRIRGVHSRRKLPS